MNFTITDGSFGALGVLLVILVAAVAVIGVIFLLVGAKQVRDEVVDDEGDDPDILA